MVVYDHLIRIHITPDEVARRQERLLAVDRLEAVSPIPVLVLNGDLAYLPWLGLTLEQVYRDPELMLRSQLEHSALVMNTVPCDNAGVGAGVELSAAALSSALGCEVFWRPGSRPTVKPWVRTEEDLLRLERTDVIHGGMHGRTLEMRDAMMRVKDRYAICYDGGEPFNLETIGMRGGAHGPFTLAGEIAGNTEFIIDLIERPDYAHSLLQILAEKEIEWITFVKKTCEAPFPGLDMMDDMAPYLSPELYAEFALPYEQQIYDHFGGRRGMHFCVLANHLLEFLHRDLHLTSYDGFKPHGTPQEFAGEMEHLLQVLGGKMVLTPDPDPMKTSNLSYDEFYQAGLQMARSLRDVPGIRFFCGVVDQGSIEALRNCAALTRATEEIAKG